MKRIVIDKSNKAILTDFEKGEVSLMTSSPTWGLISEMYICPEDCEVSYKRGTTTYLKKANKYDIIVVFGDRDWVKEPIAVIKNADFRANVISREAEKAAQRAKDEVYASDKISSDCDSCCGC